MLQEVREIWRTTSVHGFEGQGGKYAIQKEADGSFEKFIERERRCTRMLVQDNPSRWVGGSIWSKISGKSGRPPPTILCVAKLDKSIFHALLECWQNLLSFCHNLRVLQTDRRTD